MTSDAAVSDTIFSSSASSTKLLSLALEEYENLKRLPDSRQLAAQRLHQQQLALPPMVQMPHLQQMYLEFFRSLSAEDQQTFDYSKMLQYAYELGLGPPATSVQKSSRSCSPSPRQGLRRHALATSDSNPSATKNVDDNEVVLLESDDDDDDDDSTEVID